MLGYVHIEEPTGQLEFDFSDPAPPPEPQWTQPEFFTDEEMRSYDPNNPLYEYPMGEAKDGIVYLKPHYADQPLEPGTYTITTTDATGCIKVTDNYRVEAEKRPSAWHRFWQRFFLGFEWEDKEA